MSLGKSYLSINFLFFHKCVAGRCFPVNFLCSVAYLEGVAISVKKVSFKNLEFYVLDFGRFSMVLSPQLSSE